MSAAVSLLIFPLPLCIFVSAQEIAPSSNGKTADSGSAYRGSNPCGAAEKLKIEY